jgi:hypothetical protein
MRTDKQLPIPATDPKVRRGFWKQAAQQHACRIVFLEVEIETLRARVADLKKQLEVR